MIRSYFFIPGNHPRLYEKLKTIDADKVIIDMEDSISQNEFNVVLEKIIRIENKQNILIRPKLFDVQIPIEFTFNSLLKSGFRDFIIPKFRTITDLKILENIIESLNIEDSRVILLIENPESLFTIQNILRETRLNVIGIGFGSQDYCNETGMKHDEIFLRYPRFMVSGIAKAYNKIAIDIACMNITNKDVFQKEIIDAEHMGFDAKFIIHPLQLKLLKMHKIYTETEVNEAEEILHEYNRLGKPAVFVFEGKAIEPPHLRNYQKILNWRKNYGS